MGPESESNRAAQRGKRLPAERLVRTAPVVNGRALLLIYAIVGWIPVICVVEVLRTQQPFDEVVQLLGVAAMAVFVLGWVTYSWLEHRHYGESVLRLLTHPVAAGRLEAEIECSLPLESTAPIVVRLRRQAPLGKRHRLEWQTEAQVDPRAIRVQEGKRAIVPVRLTIPDPERLSRMPARGLAPQWVLEIRRRAAWIDYHAEFVLPPDEESDPGFGGDAH